MKKEKKSAGSLGFVDTVNGRRELISTPAGILAAPVDNVIDLSTGRRVGRFLARRIEDVPAELMDQLVAARTAPAKRAMATQMRHDAHKSCNPAAAASRPRCDFASQANAQMGPCSSADHRFGTASHCIRDYFTRPGAIPRAKSTPVRADRNLYLCPAHAKRWMGLYPAGRAVLELAARRADTARS
jgi:hypothetical protein